MTTYIYYGNGACTIEGHSEVRGVEIHYYGNIEINKTANDNFAIAANNNKILIYPIGEGYLNELFTYVGEFKIHTTLVAGKDGEKIRHYVKKVMDYSELLNTNSEDMTIESQNLSSGYVVEKRVLKTKLNQPTINNLHTKNIDGLLFLGDGSEYAGSYHIHIETGKAMTGNEHDDTSQELYIKQLKRGRLRDRLIPTSNIRSGEKRAEYKNKNKIRKGR